MPRRIFFSLAVLLPLLVGLWSLRSPAALWWLLPIGVLIVVGLHDVIQDRHALLRVYDIGREDSRDYVVMDLAAGGSLGDLLADTGPLSPALTLKYAVQILAGLAAAHAAVPIAHRAAVERPVR